MEETNDLYTIESAIKTRNQKLSELKENIKKLNEMLRSYLESDESFMEASKKAKDASAKKSAIKTDLMSRPGAQGIPEKIEGVKEEKRELEESLSYYLTEYQRITGTSEFEDENGDLKQIVYTAKLVKRSGGK